MKLSSMKPQGNNAQKTFIVRSNVTANDVVSENPRVNAVRREHLCHLLPCLLKPKLVSKKLRLPSGAKNNLSKGLQFRVEPVLPNLKRREVLVPLLLPLLRDGLDVLNNEGRDGVHLG